MRGADEDLYARRDLDVAVGYELSYSIPVLNGGAQVLSARMTAEVSRTFTWFDATLVLDGTCGQAGGFTEANPKTIGLFSPRAQLTLTPASITPLLF